MKMENHFEIFWGWKNMQRVTSYHGSKSLRGQIKPFSSWAKVWELKMHRQIQMKKIEIRAKMFCSENFKEGKNLGCDSSSTLIWNLVPRFKMLMGLLGIPDLKISIFLVASILADDCIWILWNSTEVAGAVNIPQFDLLTCWLITSKCTNSALLFGVIRLTLSVGGGVAAFTSLGGFGWEGRLLFWLMWETSLLFPRGTNLPRTNLARTGNSFLSYWVRYLSPLAWSLVGGCFGVYTVPHSLFTILQQSALLYSNSIFTISWQYHATYCDSISTVWSIGYLLGYSAITVAFLRTEYSRLLPPYGSRHSTLLFTTL